MRRDRGLTPAARLGLYDPPGLGGTNVVTVLKHADRPELYGLPANPTVPATMRLSKGPLHWLGLAALAGTILGLVGHDGFTTGPRWRSPLCSSSRSWSG
jgi:hypothetical protein